jgi:hypothetical protein
MPTLVNSIQSDAPFPKYSKNYHACRITVKFNGLFVFAKIFAKFSWDFRENEHFCKRNFAKIVPFSHDFREYWKMHFRFNPRRNHIFRVEKVLIRAWFLLILGIRTERLQGPHLRTPNPHICYIKGGWTPVWTRGLASWDVGSGPDGNLTCFMTRTFYRCSNIKKKKK